MTTEKKNKDMSNVLNGMFNALLSESKIKSSSLALAFFEEDTLATIKDKVSHFEVEDFSFITFDLDEIKEGSLHLSGVSNQDAIFLFMNENLVTCHFNKLIVQQEGSACSADKRRPILRALARFYLTGDKIKWNYEAEYTYHLPKVVFTGHDDIIALYEGLRSFFYGNPEKYLKALQHIIISVKPKPDESPPV
jgi:hypothetical protein